MLPNALFRSQLPARAVCVFGNIASHSSEFHASINLIAEQTGLSARTVNSALNDLEKCGLITRLKVKGQRGEFDRNEYEITDAHIDRLIDGAIFTERKICARTHENIAHGRTQNLRTKNTKIKNQELEEHGQRSVDRDTSTPAGYPAEFEEWWATYPRKVGKGKAAKDWRRAMKRTDNHTLINASRRLAAFHAAEGTDPRFIPHPSTWLNRDGWEDDLTPSMPRRQADGTRPEDWAIRRGEPMSEMARNIDRLFGRPADVIDGECWEEQPKEIGQ